MRIGAVKQTRVCVVWGPSGADAPDGVLQVTLLFGKRRTEEDKLAVQAYLDAVKRIQDLPNPETG